MYARCRDLELLKKETYNCTRVVLPDNLLLGSYDFYIVVAFGDPANK